MSAITYQGTLQPAVAQAGINYQSDSTGTPFNIDNPIGAGYHKFYAFVGNTIVVSVLREESELDPALWIYKGLFSDTSEFVIPLVNTDPNYVSIDDDSLPPNIPGPFGDPRVTFVAPVTGWYTAIVTAFWQPYTAPNPYTITATGIEPIAGTLPVYNPSLITVVAKVKQSLASPQFVIGGKGGAAQDEYKLFKKSTTYSFNLWRSPVHLIGSDFDVLSISFPLITNLASGTTITPKLYFDDETSSSVGTTINLTNYSNTNKLIKLTSKNFDNSVHGKYNFFLELQFTGTVLAVPGLPMFMELEVV